MILPDANLILYAYDLESPFHPVAADWWTRCLNEVEPVGLAQVIVFAFLRLSTSPKVFANPFSLADAIPGGARLVGPTECPCACDRSGSLAPSLRVA